MNKVEKQIDEIDEIRKDVEHCTAVQDDGEPCYHCKQKWFLLEQIKVMGDVVAAMSPGPQVSSDPDGWGSSRSQLAPVDDEDYDDDEEEPERPPPPEPQQKITVPEGADGATGWLSPDGLFYPCGYAQHGPTAWKLGLTDHPNNIGIEVDGWARCGVNHGSQYFFGEHTLFGDKVNEKIREYCIEQGIELPFWLREKE